VGGEEGQRPGGELRDGVGLLVGVDLGVGQPGVVIDCGVDVVVAGLATPVGELGAVPGPAPTTPAGCGRALTSMWIRSPGRSRS
jgi:hypothetical protein